MTVCAKVVASDALEEILQGLFVAGLLALAESCGHVACSGVFATLSCHPTGGKDTSPLCDASKVWGEPFINPRDLSHLDRGSGDCSGPGERKEGLTGGKQLKVPKEATGACIFTQPSGIVAWKRPVQAQAAPFPNSIPQEILHV